MINFEPNVIEVTVSDPYIQKLLRNAITKNEELEKYIKHVIKNEVMINHMKYNNEWMDYEPDYVMALIKLPVFPARKVVNEED